MNDILFRFFLNFKNDDFGRVEISEPFKFDGASFTIEQDSKRYGRDVTFGNEEVSLEFYDGVYANNLTHEIKQILRYYNDFGFESEVEFIINKDGLDFVVGVLDFEQAETDEYTYFKTKVIQDTNRAAIKRREDIEVDLFSDENLDLEYIEPIQTNNILLQAKPVLQVSEWEADNPVFSQTSRPGIYSSSVDFFNPFVILKKYKVEDSYIPFEKSPLNNSITTLNESWKEFRYLKAKEDLTNITLSIKGLCNISRIMNEPNREDCSITLYYVIYYDSDLPSGLPSGFTQVGPFIRLLGGANTNSYDYDESVIIPEIKSGQSLYLFFTHASNFGNDIIETNFSLGSYINIIATSTAVDSVITGVRHIDLIKQVTKSINGMSVIAPKYDVGGQFYDNFVFNGKLIRQFNEQPFYAKFKDAVAQLEELNADYQINNNNVYIGQYNDYYPNKEIAAFFQAPDSDFKSDFNKRYVLNTFEYKYKSFEQDRDEENTIDAIHTDSQWLLPNKQVETIKKIDVEYIRDPFSIESARRQGIYAKDSTSLSADDKIFIIDVVPLPPSSRRNFIKVLKYKWETNILRLLTDNTFNWLLLGFKVGDVINVKIGAGGSVDFNVITLENTIITLSPVVGVYGDTSGEIDIKIDYPLTDVQFTNRTSEEFNIIDNISSGDNFSNLQYSIRRNMQHWESYINTACKYVPNGIIKNTYFKSNGNAVTQFRSGAILKENGNINVNTLSEKILSPKVFTTKVQASFNEVLGILNDMQTINIDNSIGGFIRISDNNGKMVKVYPSKLDYVWADETLEVVGEEKNESDLLTIETIGDELVKINEVGYDSKIVKPFNIKTKGDYITLFDYKGVALTNEKKYDKVSVNSFIFSNIVELSNELLSL